MVQNIRDTGDYVKKKTEEVLLDLGIAKVGHDHCQKVADNGSNMVKGWHSLACIDHTIERSVRLLWIEHQVKESFDKGKKVVTFSKSSTIGRNDLGQVQEEMYDHKLGMLQKECKTRWSSTYTMGDSLMTTQENVQMYCVKEQMTDGDGNKFNMSFEDWDVVGQGTASLSTIAAVVNQTKGDKYVTSSLVLSFINTCSKSLAGDGSIKQSWFRKGNSRSEFPVSLDHESIKSSRKSVREDLELRWVTNLSEERKRFYLIATLLDPHTKLLSFCNNKYFPSSWKDEGHTFLSMEFKGVSSTSLDVDPSCVNGETELNAYMRVQQVTNDTDPLMWWKQYQQEFPRLVRIVRQDLTVTTPERLFSSVGLVKSDLRAYQQIGVCQLLILPSVSTLCVCLGDCGLPLALFQVVVRVLVY